MADRYWVGGTGTWGSSQTTNWSAATGLSFTASCTATALTTTGSPALVVGMTVWSSTHVSLGTIVSGSLNSWVVTVGGTYTSQGMSAATVGASVPTAADNVFFNANSNSSTTAFTVTMADTPRVCNDFTASGLDGVMTLAGTNIGLTVSGSLTFQATNFTRTYTGATTFNATTTGKTVTTNGVSLGVVTFNGVGGGWTLGFDLTALSAVTVTNGTFDTSSSGNYAVTANNFSSSNSNARTINLNASTITLSTSITPWDMSTSTNATLNAGASTINCSSTSATFAGGGLTYYNVAFTSTTATTSSKTITGANTFTNLTVATVSSPSVNTIVLSANQTISGIFTISGANSVQRMAVVANAIGTTRTLTCVSIAAMSDVDFRDITIAGAHGTLSGTRLGNAKGNTNITFDAAKTVYYGQTGSANWGATGSGSWSATSGGALDATQFPLAQDTAVFPAATYPASGSTTTVNASYSVGTIDMSLRTSNTMTLAVGVFTFQTCGNWINGTGITISGTGSILFSGRTTQTITSEGRSFSQNININSPSGSVTLQDALTTSTSFSLLANAGTLDLNNVTASAGAFSSNTTTTRAIAFGTGNITITGGGGTVWNMVSTTGFTTTGTQVVNFTYGGGATTTVTPGPLSEANSISFNFTAGSYPLSLFNTGFTSVRNLNFTGTPGFSGTLGAIAGTSTIYGNLTLSAGMSLTASTSTMTFAATSGTKTISTAVKTLDFPVTFDGVGGTWQLQAAMTVGATRFTTLTNGTLDLNSFALSSGAFSSNNANTRAIAFGATGSIVATTTSSGVTVLDMATATNFTFTGTSNISAATSRTRTFTFGSTAGATTSNRLNINTTAGGSSTQTFTGSFRQLNFTGSTGVVTGGGPPISCHGFTLAGGVTYSSNSFALVGDGTLTYTGRSVAAINVSGSGITTTLGGAGQNAQTILTNGTLDLAGYTLTNTTNIVTSAGTKNLTFNGGTVICSATSAIAFNNAAPTNFTTTAGTGTGTISMTSASAKTFVGGGSTFNCTLRQGGLGALTITGSNTFDDITNTVQPASVLFTAGTTNTFLSGFSLSGTAGNLITIDSDTAASHTLSKASGTVSVSFCSISNSTATGGATWESFYLNGNVNGGNNTGWDFGTAVYAVVIDETATATDAILSLAIFRSALSETATATDSILGRAVFRSALSETATATDSILGRAAFSSTLAETATATDSILGQAAFSSALSETATTTDSVLSFADFYAALTETATATDSVLSFADLYAALAETTTATDSVLSFLDFFVSLEETATATDSSLVAPSIFNAPVAEIATATDDVSPPGSIYNAPVSETVTISDLVLALFLWNLIDDSQSVTWQNINSSPGTTWSPIDTDPDTGWSVTPTVN